MDRMLYVAMTGAQQTLRSQALTSHNLANQHGGVPQGFGRLS
jgi:flagellar basal body rod protein FlgF